MKSNLAVSALLCLAALSCSGKYDYRDASAPIDKRVEDLLSRMTLEEKVGQMNQFAGIAYIRNAENLRNKGKSDSDGKRYSFYKDFPVDSVTAWTERGWTGSFLHTFTREDAVEAQRLALKSRLGIPLIMGIDAVHGNAFCMDNTTYPDAIAMASTFDRALVRQICSETALEMRATGMHWTFAPGVDIARDPRWGRCGETFGEDSYLVGEMGRESVIGYANGGDPTKMVLACAKHLVAGGQSLNGANKSPSEIPDITLHQTYYPPFIQAIKAGVGSVMPAHNDINGVPCHINRHILTDLLRNEWGFDGIVISDWLDIEQLYRRHKVAADRKDSFRLALESEIDMHMQGIGWMEDVCSLVREGVISESRIDASVRRILKAKFSLGLFEHPFPGDTSDCRLCPEHRATALRAAREGIVLLKNDGILPLDKSRTRRVMLSGISADSHNILGDWSAVQKRENYTTVLQGLRQVNPGSEVEYVSVGLTPLDITRDDIRRAVDAARRCDVAVLAVGDYLFRGDKGTTCGENRDRADITLVGMQKDLIREVAATGTPVILVLVSGRPLAIGEENRICAAVMNAWEPGMYGGQAIAEIIYGDSNPSGKLSMTMPAVPGQSLLFYSHKKAQEANPFIDSPAEPLYPFGFGLSYTSFSFSAPALSEDSVSLSSLEKGRKVTVTAKVTNTGDVAGGEVVQMYVHDKLASVTRPVKELKDFTRVALAPGESAEVSFDIGLEDLSFVNPELKQVCEPGEFEILVGDSSRDADLKRIILTVK